MVSYATMENMEEKALQESPKLETPDAVQKEIYQDFLALFRSSLKVAKMALDGDIVKHEITELKRESGGVGPKNIMKLAIERARMKTTIAMRVLDKAPPLNKNASEAPINLNFNIPRPEELKETKVIDQT